jgi:hypothetical protein
MFDGMEDKFIVINRKRFDEINENSDLGFPPVLENHPEIHKFLNALKQFNEVYESIVGKPINQKYIVINQDEPYAEEVWNIIKKYEEEK